jgi:hypothetical protein
MSIEQMRLSPGQWVVANCGDHPSDKNCMLVMMAPATQRNDLLDAAVDHAVKSHGHQNSAELRQQIDQMLEIIIVE